MISTKTKMLCLMAVALTASGCGGGGGSSENSGDTLITDPQTTPQTSADEPIVAAEESIVAEDDPVTTTTEVAESVDTSDAMPTPVVSVSSGQMDAFIANPLLAAIPSELNGGSSTSLPSNFITNPLLN